jgi:hypothetical protein
VATQQAPLSLSPALQRDALLEENVIGVQPWAAPFVPDLGDGNSFPDTLLEENTIRGQSWPAAFVSGLDVGVFPNPSGSVVAQQAPLGLPPTRQQLLPVWSEENIIRGQPWPAVFDVGAFPNPSGSVVIQQAPLGLPPAPQQPPPPRRFPCAQPGCSKSFKRDYERTRHQNTHSDRQGLHLCPVPGCPKSYGGGFSRADKVTGHLWQKHADLGYTKRVL